MSATSVAWHALLVAGVAMVLVSAVGTVAGRSVFERLHYLSAASTVGAPLVVAAVALAQEHPGRATVKLLVIAALLVVSGPVVVVATGNAASRREGKEPP